MFSSKEEAATFLGAIIDGEGSVGFRSVKGTRGFARDVRITNTDHGLLDHCVEACRMLGIECSVYDRSSRSRLGTKPISDLVIVGRENLLRLREVVKLRSQVKEEKLDSLLSSYIRKHSKPTRDVLGEMLGSGMTHAQIATTLGTAKSNVAFWISGYGLASARNGGRPAKPRPTPEELRELRATMSARAVAEMYGVSHATVLNWERADRDAS